MDAKASEWKETMLAMTSGVTANHIQVLGTSIAALTSVLIWRDNHSGVIAKATDVHRETKVSHWERKKAASEAFMKMSEEKATATKAYREEKLRILAEGQKSRGWFGR